MDTVHSPPVSDGPGQREERKDVPFREKEEGDRLFKDGLYADASKSYAKALLAVRILLQDGHIDAGELVDKYTKGVVVSGHPLTRRYPARTTLLCAVLIKRTGLGLKSMPMRSSRWTKIMLRLCSGEEWLGRT